MRNAFDDQVEELFEEACGKVEGLSGPALRVISRLSGVPYNQLNNLRRGMGIEVRYLPIICNYLRG